MSKNDITARKFAQQLLTGQKPPEAGQVNVIIIPMDYPQGITHLALPKAVAGSFLGIVLGWMSAMSGKGSSTRVEGALLPDGQAVATISGADGAALTLSSADEIQHVIDELQKVLEG